MLTPVFELSQDESHVTVSIEVPYAKVSDIDVQFENTNFMFFSKPYYLRLNLPGNVTWVEEPSVTYDSEKKLFKVYVPKKNKGEVFENLDANSCLFIPTKTHFLPTLQSDDEEGETDLCVDLKLAEEKCCALSATGQQCGFANSYPFSVFNLEDEISDIFDVKEPQKKTIKICRKERLAEENLKFDEEHYLADKYNDEEIQLLLQYNPEWDVIFENHQDNSSVVEVNFTTKEKNTLENLGSKEYCLDESRTQKAVLGLLDILFAYAYNKRSTEGENTVESAWTINKLSATLSWLEVFSSVEHVAISCIRRSLIYPLYRHFELAVTVMEDVRKIVLLGRNYITKCLLEIYELFAESDPRYILNDLYIKDYILWISNSCSSDVLIPIAKKLNNTLVTKGEAGLNLVDIDSLALVAWNNRDVLQDHHPGSTSSSEASLCATLNKMNIDASRGHQDKDGSEYEVCNSCTSDSYGTSSSSYETSSDDYNCSSDTVSDDDDDDDDDGDSDGSGSYHEFNPMMRGASVGDRTR